MIYSVHLLISYWNKSFKSGVVLKDKKAYSTFTAFVVLLLISAGLNTFAQNLIWNDEFDGTSLDLAKWVVWDEVDWSQDGEVSMFRPYNVEVSNGTLKLYNQQESQTSWSGAHIDATHHPQYNYLEARIRHSAPDTHIWATWWTVGWQNNDWAWPPEFDICEFYGQPNESPGNGITMVLAVETTTEALPGWMRPSGIPMVFIGAKPKIRLFMSTVL
jgi:beta-glucanase (GH16 family)